MANAVFALAAEAGIAVVDDIVGQVFTRRETAAAGGDVLNALAARSWIAIPVLFLQRSIMVCAASFCICDSRYDIYSRYRTYLLCPEWRARLVTSESSC